MPRTLQLRVGSLVAMAAVGLACGSKPSGQDGGASFRLSVTVAGSGGGSVTSSPSGINCSTGTCTGTFASGTQVQLTAAPSGASAFAGWAGACSGTGACSVTLGSDQAVTATFNSTSGSNHTLNVLLNGSGAVTSSPTGLGCVSGACSGTFLAGTVVTLTATGNLGSLFTGWSGACTGVGPCTVTLTSDMTATATFSLVESLTVTLSGGGTGSVTSDLAGINCSSGTCSAPYGVGVTVTLTATAGAGSDFAGWQGCSPIDAGIAGGTCSLVMSSNQSVTANFLVHVAGTFPLNVALTGQGFVSDGTDAGIECSTLGGVTSGNCAVNYLVDAGVTLTQTPGLGWKFTGWGGACTGTGTCSVAMTAPQNVTATFIGPFDFAVSLPNLTNPFSMIAGETSSLPVLVNLTGGGALPVALSATGLPAGASAVFVPASVIPDGGSVLSLTTTAATPLGQYPVNVTGTFGTTVHSAPFTLEVRSPYAVPGAQGIALEPAGTALVATGSSVARVDTSTMAVVKTLATGLAPTAGVAVESGGATALVLSGNSLLRMSTSSGAVSTVTSALLSPLAVAPESGGMTALVTDCGTNCQTAGRLVRVDLSSGSITPITPGTFGLSNPVGVAVESGGTTALVLEGSGQLLRITLSGGSAVGLASGLPAPEALAIETGGATAVIAAQGQLMRVNLARGSTTLLAATPYQALGGIAIEPGGKAAVVAAHSGDTVLRVALTRPLETLTPSRQSVDVLYAPFGFAVEAGGATALVTDCGAGNCTSTGRVVRTNLTTGVVTALTSTGINTPRAIQLEAGGASALVAEAGAGRLLRVFLDGGIAPLATGLANPQGVAIEAGGTTALVTAQNALERITLSSGVVVPLATATSSSWEEVALEPGGTTALVTDMSGNALQRVTLGSGSVTALTTGLQAPVGVVMEPGGTALVTESQSGRLLRVNRVTGTYTVLGSAFGSVQGVALEPSGLSALSTDGINLIRMGYSAPSANRPTAAELDSAAGVVFEADAGAAFILDCTPVTGCLGASRLVSLDLKTGAATPLVTNFTSAHAVAVEDGGLSVLVTDCGAISCTSSGRLLRVVLPSTQSPILPALNVPDGIAIEPGGATALVAESGTGHILRVDLAAHSFSVVAAGLNNPRQVYREAGATALVAEDNALVRIDLSNGNATSLTAWPISRFAVEPGRNTAIILGDGTTLAGALLRVNLTTGGIVNLFGPGIPNTGGTLALNPAGSTGLFTETRPGTGGVFEFPVPP